MSNDVNIQSLSDEQIKTLAQNLPGELAARGMEASSLLGNTSLAGAEIAPPAQGARIDAISMLSPEQREQAAQLTDAMAAKFEQFGAKTEDFRVLQVEAESGEKHFVVAYAAGNGLDLGDPAQRSDLDRSWYRIFHQDNTDNFMVEVNGRQFDTRTGMTRAAYAALATNAKTNGEKLPDSQGLKNHQARNGMNTKMTKTWLTGEPSRVKKTPHGKNNEHMHIRGVADTAYCLKAGPQYSESISTMEGTNERFRPTVVLE